ncbi:hypothetical protein [Pseudomonas sp. ML96]|uniref:hypothetical protein n=1 Tax=Pseudomonas sp. ML96 TaxID=1523503 RepID=UPI0005BDA6A5|nr:hypothetical protein [Pseudomonas sp. ML96]
MHLKQALLTLLLCPFLAFAKAPQEDIQNIRFLAFNSSSHLLLHYNPVTSSANPEHAEKYRADMQQLNMLLQQTPSPELQAEGARLQSLIETLEQHRGDEAHLYPIWINPILESQARLDSLAQQLDPESDHDSSPLQTLDRLMLNSQRLLLYYQTRAFGSLAVYIDDLKQGAPETLDQAIRQDLATLQQMLPQQATELSKLERSYNYIRRHLLQQTGEFVPGSVAYYLEQIGLQSQQIAEQLRQS